jgi:hypothetical protein
MMIPMTAITASSFHDSSVPSDLRVLGGLSAALVVMMLASCVGLLVDQRMWKMDSVWLKPLKFQSSMLIQTLTVLWGLRAIALPPGAVRRWLTGAWIAAITFEAAYITLQAARGVGSHFNRSTPWESIASSLMLVGAVTLVLIPLWIGVVALERAVREGGNRRLEALAIGFISGAVLAGWSGGLMGPQGFFSEPLMEPIQRMPWTGWVISQADLRVAHFTGLHQMQAIPAMSFIASRMFSSHAWHRALLGGLLVLGVVLTVTFSRVPLPWPSL